MLTLQIAIYHEDYGSIIVHLAHNDRQGFQSGQLRSVLTAVPGDNFIAALRSGAGNQRRKHTVLLDTFHGIAHRIIVQNLEGMVLEWKQLSNRNLPHLLALFFLPYVTNIVAVATVWQALFHKTKGPINMLLMLLGISEAALPGWLSSSTWALPAIMLVLLWKDIGYSILMYSSALQQIPQELYEAADMDGAGPIRKFFSITLPQLRPTTFLLTVLGIISSLQMWSFVQIITKGGPGTSTYTLGLYIYRSGFITYRTGYACALAWLLCAIVMVFTVIRWRTESKFSAE